MVDFRDTIEKAIGKQSQLFSFLVAPESYLLTAGLLSGMVSIPMLILNAISIHCVVTACSALQDESNNFQSWLIFEGLTGFFLSVCILSLVKYFRIRKQRQG